MAYSAYFRSYFLTYFIIFFTVTGHMVSPLKFQSSNLNAGRVRLVLFQGKDRYEVIGRSCPLGVAFVTPQLFSCACVTGVWAFYDIMCAAPLQIVAGVNHCFRMPLNTYIQQVINVGNPTRAHGDSLTFFDGDMETVRNKFFRETHSELQTTNRMLSIGSTWTLRSQDGRQELCLDSSKHGIFDNSSSPSLPTAYCAYGNVSEFLYDVGSISAGCHSYSQKIEPENCYPYLESNTEDVCMDLAILEAYELAVEEESNDLTRQNGTREFKRLVKTKVHKKKSTPTTTQYPTTTTPIWRSKSLYAGGKSVPQSHKGSKARTPTVNDDGLDVSKAARKQRQLLDTDKESAALTAEQMKAVYMQTLEREEDFLKPTTTSAGQSDMSVFKFVLEHQRSEIKAALKLSDPSQALPKSNMEKIFDKSAQIMTQQCPMIRSAFLSLATSAFDRLLRRYSYQYKMVHNIDWVLSLLEKCRMKGPAYNFVQDGGSECDQKNPTKVQVGNETIVIEIPPAYNSAPFEPMIETVWKLTVHTLLYCEDELSRWVNPGVELSIAFSEMLSTDINIKWNRNKTVEEEYAGVLGDMRQTLRSVDICTTVAALQTGQTKVTYARPPHKPVSPPEDPVGDEPEDSSTQGFLPKPPRELRHISKTQKKKISHVDPSEDGNEMNLNNILHVGREDHMFQKNTAMDRATFRLGSATTEVSTSETSQPVAQTSTMSPTPWTTRKVIYQSSPLPSPFTTTSTSSTVDGFTHHSPYLSTADMTIHNKLPNLTTTHGATHPSPTVSTTPSLTGPRTAQEVTPTPSLSEPGTNEPQVTATPEVLPSTLRATEAMVVQATPAKFTITQRAATKIEAEATTIRFSSTTSSEESYEDTEETSTFTVSQSMTTNEALDVSTRASKYSADSPKERRRREAPNLTPEEENWRQQRMVMNIAYCLKKFDEPRVHLGQDCE